MAEIKVYDRAGYPDYACLKRRFQMKQEKIKAIRELIVSSMSAMKTDDFLDAYEFNKQALALLKDEQVPKCETCEDTKKIYGDPYGEPCPDCQEKYDPGVAESAYMPGRPATKVEVDMAKRLCEYQDEVHELKQKLKTANDKIENAKEIINSQSFWCELADKECVGMKSIVYLVDKALKGKPKSQEPFNMPCPDPEGCKWFKIAVEKLPKFDDITGLYADDEPEPKEWNKYAENYPDCPHTKGSACWYGRKMNSGIYKCGRYFQPREDSKDCYKPKSQNNCGNGIDISSKGIITADDRLLCMDRQADEPASQKPAKPVSELVEEFQAWQDKSKRGMSQSEVCQKYILYSSLLCDRLEAAEKENKVYVVHCNNINTAYKELQAKLEAAEKEKEELKVYIHNIRPYADCYVRILTVLGIENDVLGYIKQLQGQLKTANENLKIYGQHQRNDDTTMCEYMKHSDYPCTCGLDQALKGKQ